MARFGRLTLVLGWLWGCAAEPAPEVWFGACGELSPQGRCTIKSGAPLVVWVSETPNVGAVEVDGVAVEAARSVVDGGARLEIPVEGARSVRVALGAGRGAWELALGAEEAAPEGAREASDEARQHHLRGASAAAFEAARDAEHAYRAAGWARDAAMLHIRATVEELRLGGVDAIEETLLPATRGDAALWYADHHVRGMILGRQGDVRGSRAHLEEIARIARRALPAGWLRMAERDVASFVTHSGTEAQARAALRSFLDEVQAKDTLDCEDIDALHHRTWLSFELESKEPLAEPRKDRIRALASSMELALGALERDPTCGQGRLGSLLTLNLALASISVGALDRAAQLLAALSFDVNDQDLLVWNKLALAELAFAQGDTERAVELWADAHARAVAVDSLELSWRTLDGWASALAGTGDAEGALARWDEATQAFQRHGLMVSLQEGRAQFFGSRSRATAAEVAVLRAHGRDAEAFDVARGFRAQLLGSMLSAGRLHSMDEDARRRWRTSMVTYEENVRKRMEWLVKLSTAPLDERPRIERSLADLQTETSRLLDEGLTTFSLDRARALRAPGEGELLVTWLASETGWMVLARSRAAVVVADVPGAWSGVHEWPEELDAAFAEASLITLLAIGEPMTTDAHLLPWRGAPLIAQRAVRWATDRADVEAGPPASSPTALVVVDPLRNLSQARAEGEEVVSALRGGAVQTVVLEGKEATREAVGAALDQRPTLLHFAGHGEVPDNPWFARLKLSSGAWEVSDVLALSEAPQVVVLAGCETARTGEALVATVGLAQAFLQVGSEAAVATMRPVDDGLTRAFSRSFYAAAPLQRGVGIAFREAVLALAQSHPDADYGAFRLLVP